METVSAEGCGLSVDVLGRIRDVLAECPRLDKAVLYGSRAKGTHRPASDIDVTLIGSLLTHEDLLGLDTALDELLLPYKMDVSLFDTIDTPALREHIERVGRVLYEKPSQAFPPPDAKTGVLVRSGGPTLSEAQASRGSIFFVLAGIFKRHAVHPVLVGGYAVISYTIQRMTFDIDFIMTAEDCRRMEPDILALGYSVFNRKDAFVQYKSSSLSGYRDLDFLLTERSTVEKLISSGKTVMIAGEAFTVPSPLHLIAMKLHALAQNPQRELKDLQDIVGLMRSNRINPAESEVRQIFEKYKAMQYFARVSAFVGGEHGK